MLRMQHSCGVAQDAWRGLLYDYSGCVTTAPEQGQTTDSANVLAHLLVARGVAASQGSKFASKFSNPGLRECVHETFEQCGAIYMRSWSGMGLGTECPTASGGRAAVCGAAWRPSLARCLCVPVGWTCVCSSSCGALTWASKTLCSRLSIFPDLCGRAMPTVDTGVCMVLRCCLQRRL
jgi:hypothetical protein